MPTRIRRPLGYLFLGCAMLFAGSSWILQSDPLLACRSRKIQLETQAAEQTRCVQDSDCALLSRECGPLATCGLPVRADALAALENGTKAFEEECPGYGGLQCVSCIALEPRCVDSVCTAREVDDLRAPDSPDAD